MKQIILCSAVVLCLLAPRVYCQVPEALSYGFPKLTELPPYYSGQPTDVAFAYYLFDHCMRVNSWHEVDSFVSLMRWSDTTRYVADAIYRITDDNPISFHLWLCGRGVLPDPYKPKADPSHSKVFFENRYAGLAADTGRSGYLVASDYIMHVSILDTTSIFDSTAYIAKRMIRVTAEILDPIKGKYVPDCFFDSLLTAKNNNHPFSFVNSAGAHHADSGSCIQFEYSPSWDRVIEGDVGTGPTLQDSSGTWIRPGHEYVVFLGLETLANDTTSHFFTVKPLWGVFGKSAGMYPVQSGIVGDPSDDFGLGVGAGLTVSEWKTRLRARIYHLINP